MKVEKRRKSIVVEEILNPIILASILSLEIFLEDLEGIAIEIEPTNIITTKNRMKYSKI